MKCVSAPKGAYRRASGLGGSMGSTLPSVDVGAKSVSRIRPSFARMTP